MPRRKTSEVEAAPVSETPMKRAETKRSATPTAHKHTTTKTTKKTQSPSLSEPIAAAPAAITHEQIAIRAYFLWEARGKQDGSPAQDWFLAEQELRADLK